MSGSVSEREAKVLGIIETARAKRGKFRDERITMAHGAGGKATQSLIEGLLAPAFGMTELADAATVEGFALTTDAFVVKPLRFPGGSIGELAVNGTVNDLAMAGARPLALTLSLILEEGLPAETLREEVAALARGGRGGRRADRRPATPRSSSAATPTGCTSRTTGLGAVDPRARLSPGGAAAGRPHPALRPRRRPRHRDHARARRVRAGRDDRVRHALAVARGRRAARRGRRRSSTACATRPAAASPPC